jgi:uncharacterized protein (TIGR00369 family)
MTDNTTVTPTSTDLFRAWFEHSPFTQQLDLRIEALEPDSAELLMPFDPSRTTYADIVHGGAIAALADVAATAAAWSAADLPETPRGATVGMSLQYLSAGRGDLRARARVLRRGALCACDVDISDAPGKLVAKALITYKIG